MNSVSLDIKGELVDAGVAAFAGTDPDAWALYLYEEPPSPDRCVTLYDLPGPMPGYTLDLKPELRYSSFQVRIRSMTYGEGVAKHEEIDTVLKQLRFSVGDVRYHTVTLSGELAPLGTDDNRRFIFTANYRALRHQIEE